MSRDIKFKIWDKDCKKFITNTDYKEFVINMQGQAYIISGYFDNAKVDEYDCVEILQYTGLKDKHGKEIYEGDIVSHPNPSLKGAEVKFTKGLFRIVAKDGRDDLLYYCYDKLEVIGNIYQHKDLLK